MKKSIETNILLLGSLKLSTIIENVTHFVLLLVF